MSNIKSYIILILLTSILFGVIRYQLNVQATGGIFFFPSDDSYITLSYSRKLAQGFPFRLNKDSEPTPLEPSLLTQCLYASAYLIGFRTPESLSSFAFWINILFLSLSLVFIFLILIKIGFSEMLALITTLFILIYNPFRYSFVMAVGYGIFTFLFYLFIYLILSKNKFFILPSIFLILARPEGIIVVGFTFLFLLFRNFFNNRKILIFFIFPFLVYIFQTFFYFSITRRFTTTGLPTQFIFNVYPLSGALYLIIVYLIEYLKGVLLSFYPLLSFSFTRITFLSAQLPPLFFVFILLGILKIIRSTPLVRNFFLYMYLLFLIIIIISSFTIFQGVHLLRHTAWLLPVFIVTGFLGIEYLKKVIKEIKIINGVLIFYFIFQFLLFVNFILRNTAISIKLSLPQYLASQWIKKNIKPNDRKLLMFLNSRLDFFLNDTNTYFYSLTFPDNWRLVKYGKNYRSISAPLEVFYYELQKFKNKKWYAVYTKEDENVLGFEILKDMIDSVIHKENILSDNYYTIAKFNTKPIINAHKVFILNNTQILDEINPGDPVSEFKHNYKAGFYFPYGKAFPFITFGKINKGDSIYDIADVGYLNEYEIFNFYIKERDSIYLIIRLCSLIPYLISYNEERFASIVELKKQFMKIYLNGIKIDSLVFKNVRNFTEFSLKLPVKLLNEGRNELKIFGKFISTHYFIIKKGRAQRLSPFYE